MKNLVFGLMACFTLLAVSCDSSTTDEDSVYEQGVDKRKIPSQADSFVDKRKIPSQANK